MGFLYFNAFTVSYPPTAANMNGPQLLTSNFTVNTSTQNLAFRLVSTDDSISIQLYAVAAVNVGFMMNTYYMGCLFYM